MVAASAAAMSQPMLSIEHSQASSKPQAVANLLPCRIHHTGPTGSVSAYWNPTQAPDSASVAYLRGRKLLGKAVALPEQYQGVLVERRPEEDVERQSQPQEQGEDGAGAVEMGTMQVTACFDKMVVWSHEAVADSTSDTYVRSIDEWLQVADQIHWYPEQGRADAVRG